MFEDGVRMMADCLGIALDEVRFSYQLGACTKDVDLGWYRLPAGSLGGAAFNMSAWLAGYRAWSYIWNGR